MKKGLPLVIDEKTKCLILGSFPGQKSLNKREYYAYPTNRFWELIACAVSKSFISKSYEEKIIILKTLGIGLWDIYHECERKGSGDTGIKNGNLNDFSILKEAAPNLTTVCLCGNHAQKYRYIFFEMGYKVLELPSSSGAYDNETHQFLELSRVKNIPQ